MSQSSPTISVIIPTYNGAHRICNTLDAIFSQSVLPDEIIVVIDGSTDATEQVVEKYTQKFNNLKIVKQPNMGRAVVRNTGVKKASGKIIIFYDDDTRPQISSVQKHLEIQSKNECLCGGLAIEDPSLCKTDIQKYKLHLSLKWTSKYEGLNKLNSKNLFLTAANFSISKGLFQNLSGFNESLTDAEDYDLGRRALEQGYNVFFDKKNISWHDDFITCRSYIKRRREYELATARLNESKPPKWYKAFFYSFFSNRLWVYAIDQDRFVKILPKRLRFFLYTLVIWGMSRYYVKRNL